MGKVLGQGSIGLTRALMAAGSRSILASLWRVDDDATRDLMVAFYKEYLQHGNKGLALQNAMKQVRQQYSQPRYWAAFSLFGMAE
jgi:CHAT domain-containing protein